MKPVKKNSQGAKKKDFSDNQSLSKIPDYFRNEARPIFEEPINEFENTKPIYVKMLKKTLKTRDAVGKDIPGKISEDLVTGQDNAEVLTPGQGEDNIKELATGKGEDDVKELATGQGKDVNVLNNSFEIDVSKETDVPPECTGCSEKDVKYKDLMKVYLKLTHRYTQLDQKFTDLLQTKTHTSEPEADGSVSNNNDVFTPNEVKYLQAMPLDKKTDSTFVLKCLEFAYKDDPSVLSFKTLKGKPESVQYNDNGAEQQAKKHALTPKKVKRIKQLFICRISKCKLDEVAYGERIRDANVNKLFATGILNIAKKIK